MKEKAVDDLFSIGNITVHTKEEFAVLNLDTCIFDMQVIYSAAYALMEKAHIFLSGNPVSQVLVEIRKKTKDQDLLELALEFNNSMINYSYYRIQAEKTKEIRTEIVRSSVAPVSADVSCGCDSSASANDGSSEVVLDEFDDGFDDPEGIAIPWEEKYGEGGKGPTGNDDALDLARDGSREDDLFDTSSGPVKDDVFNDEDIEIPWDDIDDEEQEKDY